MSLVINTNMASLQTQSNVALVQENLRANFAKLSSGYRINTAADDASGLAISESMSMQIRGLSVAERNVNSAISCLQTMDGALGQISGVLMRMRDLAVQASNGDLTLTDSGYLNTEYAQLRSEIDRIANATKFNGLNLLGATPVALSFQIDTNQNDQLSMPFLPVDATGLNVHVTNVTIPAAAQTAITQIDSALSVPPIAAGVNGLNGVRAYVGAMMNRMQFVLGSIQSRRTNLSAANSRIRDVDVAEEGAQLARNQVIAQASASVLAQANQAPQLALMLLR